MKTLFSVAGCIIASILLMSSAHAQRGVRDQDVAARILKVDVFKEVIDDKYPRIKGISESQKKDYGIILVEYELGIKDLQRQRSDVGGVYVNELEFEWKVILSAESKNIDPNDVVRLETTIQYTDLKVHEAKDRKKQAIVVIDQRLIERYLSKFDEDGVWWELRIRCGGKTILTTRGHGKDFSSSDKEKAELTPVSKDKKNLLTSEDVYAREDGLSSRLDSPFSWYGDENLERIKSKQDNR